MLASRRRTNHPARRQPAAPRGDPAITPDTVPSATISRPSGKRASMAGWPGRMSMESIRTWAPSAAAAGRRWSISECPVPPVLMISRADLASGESSAAMV